MPIQDENSVESPSRLVGPQHEELSCKGSDAVPPSALIEIEKIAVLAIGWVDAITDNQNRHSLISRAPEAAYQLIAAVEGLPGHIKRLLSSTLPSI